MAQNEGSANSKGIVGRLRATSINAADAFMNFTPQPGMWAATGTAVAYAPTITELRAPVAGGENIEFNAQGHSARTVSKETDGSIVLDLTRTRTAKLKDKERPATGEEDADFVRPQLETRPTLLEQAKASGEEKHGWWITTKHGLTAVWKFITTPTGFLMAIYGLNIVAWGAMLFFLLLGAAPAMNHPSKDSLQSPRKKWLEIDSQILNALFCVTGFSLAPWRFRDLYWLIKARHFHDRVAMAHLCKQNQSWFRPPAWFDEDVMEEEGYAVEKRVTFTGEVAPPTKIWKLFFVVWMYVWNTLFQVVLASFMWTYNRFDSPTWATGTFIGLGCGVSLLAGLMMWWEGRKVKKIEGPMIKVIDAVELEHKSRRPMR